MKKKIVIFGTGDHSRVITDTLEKLNKFQIIGFFDNKKPIGTLISGYPVLGNDEEIFKFLDSIDGGVLAIGDNHTRYQVAQFLKSTIPDFKYFSVVDPFTSISNNATIGNGTMVVAGSVIKVGAKIGQHVIINTRASVDHDNKIGDFAFIAPGATTGGNVTIEECAFLGIGANIVPGITIGKNSIIGAGSVVLKDIPANVLAVGTPAKIIREV